ncbi:type II toxin-antitoxin system VapC family toxin [Thiomicrospira microaerophila]|uniref:type II toxin-antitoxin system VapC family toxin n=1 Tax=Thiomicrospira microaerophila TaxID=406020 RepID=UPI0005CB6611|nr:type II toxin-antitoxin system VapC family toxin [Thiomicrospira microaerophila]
MKNKYLLDTNVVIYFFNGLTDDGALVEILRSSFNISIITKIEFLSWQKLLNDPALNDKAIEFIANARVYELDEVVANRTIKNRQRFKVKTPDAIIAATAQVHGFEIVTNNVDDFRMLDLKVTTVELK